MFAVGIESGEVEAEDFDITMRRLPQKYGLKC
jgi:hypothetical protein